MRLIEDTRARSAYLLLLLAVLLAGDDRLAEAMARSLPPGVRHLVVAQNLLPALWRRGALGGRRFEVHACEGCRIDHPHLQCRSCGSLECLEQGMLPAMLVPTEVAGFLIDEARLYLYGLCPTCRKAGTL